MTDHPEKPSSLTIHLPSSSTDLARFIREHLEAYDEYFSEADDPLEALPADQLPLFILRRIIFTISNLLDEPISETAEGQSIYDGQFSFEFSLEADEIRDLEDLISKLIEHYLLANEDSAILTELEARDRFEQIVDRIKAKHPYYKVKGTRDEVLALLAEERRKARLEEAQGLINLSDIQEKTGKISFALHDLLGAVSLDPSQLEALAPSLQRLSAKLREEGDQELARLKRECEAHLSRLLSPPTLRLVKPVPVDEE